MRVPLQGGGDIVHQKFELLLTREEPVAPRLAPDEVPALRLELRPDVDYPLVPEHDLMFHESDLVLLGDRPDGPRDLPLEASAVAVFDVQGERRQLRGAESRAAAPEQSGCSHIAQVQHFDLFSLFPSEGRLSAAI